MSAPHPAQHDPRVWRPHKGPQERFLACAADEVLYGGAAGGGKSDSLLVNPLRWIDRPNFWGLIFRREAKQLWGALWPRADELYRPLGARWRQKDMIWYFPSGAKIEFGHAKDPRDIRKYQGRSIQYTGWDELTHFTEDQYIWMFSRSREGHDSSIPLRFRAATNPGGIGHDWVLERWAPWLYPSPGQPGHDPTAYEGPWASPGQVLWFLRDDDSGEERVVAPFTQWATSRTFFPARVSDNPKYAGGRYERNLRALSLLDRMQLLHGDWMARPAPGMFFKRAWFADAFLPAVPALVVARVRYWDLAATAEERAKVETAWTAGVRISKLDDGRYVIEHIVRGRWSPGEVMRTIKATAMTDPPGTRVVIERDPGQAGKSQAWHFATELDGCDVHAVEPQGDKIGRAKPASAQAEVGNICLVKGPWNEAFLREAESFPVGVKDQIDGLSGGYNQVRMFGSSRSTSRGKRDMDQQRTGGF